MSEALQPHGLEPTRLLCPWDFPGKNTTMGCHFLLQESSPTRDRTCVFCFSCIGRQILYHWATSKANCCTQFSSVQLLICVQLFATPWIAAHRASLSITNSQSLLKLMSIESVMPSSHLILCRPLLFLPPIPPSISVFSNWINSLHEVPKVLEFQLKHQSFQWTTVLVSPENKTKLKVILNLLLATRQSQFLRWEKMIEERDYRSWEWHGKDRDWKTEASMESRIIWDYWGA